MWVVRVVVEWKEVVLGKSDVYIDVFVLVDGVLDGVVMGGVLWL